MHLAGYNVFVMPKHSGRTVEPLLQRHHDAIGHIAGEFKVLPAPWPLGDCPASFGNNDIFSATTG